MKKYNLEELIKNALRWANFISSSTYSYTYYKHDNEGHRVWLGNKHGGWSFKLKYQHPNFDKFIAIVT